VGVVGSDAMTGAMTALRTPVRHRARHRRGGWAQS